MYITMVYTQSVPPIQAKTRVKLNFLDHLAKFWELQVSYVYVCVLYVLCDMYVLVMLCYDLH